MGHKTEKDFLNKQEVDWTKTTTETVSSTCFSSLAAQTLFWLSDL